MADSPEEVPTKLGQPVLLPLVIDGGRLMVIDKPSVTASAVEPTLKVQLDTQCGQALHLLLTVTAAQRLILALAGMLRHQGYPLKPTPRALEKLQ